jgi:hypothetical protein
VRQVLEERQSTIVFSVCGGSWVGDPKILSETGTKKLKATLSTYELGLQTYVARIAGGEIVRSGSRSNFTSIDDLLRRVSLRGRIGSFMPTYSAPI